MRFLPHDTDYISNDARKTFAGMNLEERSDARKVTSRYLFSLSIIVNSEGGACVQMKNSSTA